MCVCVGGGYIFIDYIFRFACFHNLDGMGIVFNLSMFYVNRNQDKIRKENIYHVSHER